MQTFLPYPDLERSVAVLDVKRLGKQRVEAYQILRVRMGLSSGWRNHPAVRMWSGYETALCAYLAAAIREWVRRGYRNTMIIPLPTEAYSVPPWLGDPAFHAAHRSHLLRKNPAWYGRFGWSDPPDLPYVWPVRIEGEAGHAV